MEIVGNIFGASEYQNALWSPTLTRPFISRVNVNCIYHVVNHYAEQEREYIFHFLQFAELFLCLIRKLILIDV